MGSSLQRLEATVFGHVQGVFFRDTTRKQARRRGITGWVRNERDGTVRVVAEGEREDLEALVSFLQRGPSAAHVERVETKWQDASGEFSGFHVRY